jgi:predicted outer membrane repeat protein
MGLLANIAGPLGDFTADTSLPVLIAAGTASFIVLAIVLNVLKQLLFKNANEPPVVFHWFPVLGNTVTYGMDPYKFFFENRAKVSGGALRGQQAWRILT